LISICSSSTAASLCPLAYFSSAAYAFSASSWAFVLRRLDCEMSQMTVALTCALSMCAALPLLVEMAVLRWKA